MSTTIPEEDSFMHLLSVILVLCPFSEKSLATSNKNQLRQAQSAVVELWFVPSKILLKFNLHYEIF
jgi:hypothetical protein